MKPFYYVTPVYEPRSKGSGWDVPPRDDMATFYSVDSDDECGHDGAETREAAQAIADRMNAARP